MAVRGSISADVRRMRREWPTHLEKEANLAGDITVEEVRRRTPIGRLVDRNTGRDVGPSGELRRSVRKIKPRRTRRRIVTGAFSPLEHAGWVERGTRAHDIPRAGTTTLLRYWSEGELRYARRVRHPGTRGVHMFARGLIAAEKRFQLGAEQRLRVVFR